MKKILALIPENVDGCVYHRIQIPLNKLQGFELAQVNQLDPLEDEVLKNYDIVWFNRLNGIFDSSTQIARLKRLGIKYVLDMDDLWHLPKGHLLAPLYNANNIPEKLIALICNADHILTTVPQLADQLSKHNKNVTIAVNAIDPTQPQIETPSQVKDGSTIFGWCGGVHHHFDLAKLRYSLSKLHQENKTFLALAGWHNDKIWNTYESWFNGNGKYKKYIRLPGVDIYSYMKHYDYFTTVLVPLQSNLFNSCKSELKMIEAGFKKKAAIVSDVAPYINLINPTNCIAIDNDYSWHKAIKRVRESKALEQDLAASLYESVKVKHHIDTANKVREQVFNSL